MQIIQLPHEAKAFKWFANLTKVSTLLGFMYSSSFVIISNTEQNPTLLTLRLVA